MEVFAEKFDDIKILRFEVPGFEELDLNKKLFIYHLSQATLAGRDILFDQHGKYNLLLRDILEAIYQSTENKVGEDWKQFTNYLKKVWFASGPHHHYSTDKFKPGFSEDFFYTQLNQLNSGDSGLTEKHLNKDTIKVIERLIFDETFMGKRVNFRADEDLIQTSSNNFYDGVSQSEVEAFYAKQKTDSDNKKLSFGLNSRLVKDGNEVKEEVYKIGGKYGEAITQIHQHLAQAIKYAENKTQKDVIQLLMDFYETGDLERFDEFCIQWVSALDGDVDFINGFIETYGDPLGMKATWEGVVQLVDEEETKKAEIIAENALWFEQNSTTDKAYKKDEIKGVTLKAISAVAVGGDCYPASPLGINLPNAEWIREEYGSKSVTLTNISNAHHKASLSSGFAEEFTLTAEEVELEKKYGAVSDNLHTHLHECVGHGSGKLMPGVTSDALKNYASVIEETRADLCGLYFMYDAKMLELGLLPHLDAAKAHYNGYIRNGLLTQITRIKLGDDIEQAHMRNRQLIAAWVFAAGNGEVVEKIIENGKTFFRINDFTKLRDLFGVLLKEIQRIKSEGDVKAAQNIVETYGVKINQQLHSEVLKRFKKLQVPPFTGFLNPNFTLVQKDGNISDVVMDYKTDYAEQMLKYSKEYGNLQRE
ncbi:dipeptidyl-peptidase 3 family protein [Labilibacter marinus]|uniref:dipeptidyl-peptidase 3 family protein n=1 Tax=Labilibacter marinus TaxID=1477105 RepID=UPI000834F8AC|nr:dihydrofolate reductase [Labilibacter marinus]